MLSCTLFSFPFDLSPAGDYLKLSGSSTANRGPRTIAQ